jgi:hypothetical protein
MPVLMELGKNRLERVLGLAPILELAHQKPEDPALVSPVQLLESLHIASGIRQHEFLVGQLRHLFPVSSSEPPATLP